MEIKDLNKMMMESMRQKQLILELVQVEKIEKRKKSSMMLKVMSYLQQEQTKYSQVSIKSMLIKMEC
jgi:hypothetical protein